MDKTARTTMYHVTWNPDLIIQQGIHYGYNPTYSPASSRPDGNYLWDTLDNAEKYNSWMGGQGTIFQVDATGLHLAIDPFFQQPDTDDYYGDLFEGPHGIPGAYYTLDPIPPDRLHPVYIPEDLDPQTFLPTMEGYDPFEVFDAHVANNIEAQEDDPCYIVAAYYANLYPELEYQAGIYHDPKFGDQHHAWLRDQKGNIIDPTHSQFDPEIPLGKFDPSHPYYSRYSPWNSESIPIDFNEGDWPEGFETDEYDPLHWLLRGHPHHNILGPDEFDNVKAPPIFHKRKAGDLTNAQTDFSGLEWPDMSEGDPKFTEDPLWHEVMPDLQKLMEMHPDKTKDELMSILYKKKRFFPEESRDPTMYMFDADNRMNMAKTAMPLNPEHIRALPALFHSTDSRNVPSILQQGLLPGNDPNNQGYSYPWGDVASPVEGRVYLSDRPNLNWVDPSEAGGQTAVLQIDPNQLDPNGFETDEDWYENFQLNEFNRKFHQPEEDVPQRVWQTLKTRGSVAYRGVIPPSAIKVYSMPKVTAALECPHCHNRLFFHDECLTCGAIVSDQESMPYAQEQQYTLNTAKVATQVADNDSIIYRIGFLTSLVRDVAFIEEEFKEHSTNIIWKQGFIEGESSDLIIDQSLLIKEIYDLTLAADNDLLL